jgi:hypothetical protein
VSDEIVTSERRVSDERVTSDQMSDLGEACSEEVGGMPRMPEPQVHLGQGHDGLRVGGVEGQPVPKRRAQGSGEGHKSGGRWGPRLEQQRRLELGVGGPTTQEAREQVKERGGVSDRGRRQGETTGGDDRRRLQGEITEGDGLVRPPREVLRCMR